MCGRYALYRALVYLRGVLGARNVIDNGNNFIPNYNISPSDSAPIFTGGDILICKFGIDLFGKDIINARSETVVDKFNNLVSSNRCIVPANGYYEWNKEKQPFYIHNAKDEFIYFAGIFSKNGEFMIVTRDAADNIKKVHHRMPIILKYEQIPQWLNNNWKDVLKFGPASVVFYPVSRVALRPGHNSPDCVKKLDSYQNQKTVLDFFGGNGSNKKNDIEAKLNLVKKNDGD